MFARLQSELDNSLESYNFNKYHHCAIFRDWLIYKSKVAVDLGKSCRIYSDEYHDGGGIVAFRIESLEKIDAENVESFLLPNSHKSEHTDRSKFDVTLPSALLFETLIPAFKSELPAFIAQFTNNFNFYKLHARASTSAVQKTKQFFSDIDTFVSQHGMTTSACDIFEFILFKMAKMASIPNKDIYFIPREARIIFQFSFNPDQAHELATKQLLEFFKLRDESAYLAYKRVYAKDANDRFYPSYALGAIEYSLEPRRARMPTGYERISYEISVDGATVASTIFDEFKLALQALAATDPESLKPFQDKSKAFWARAKKMGDSSVLDVASLFNSSQSDSDQEITLDCANIRQSQP